MFDFDETLSMRSLRQKKSSGMKLAQDCAIGENCMTQSHPPQLMSTRYINVKKSGIFGKVVVYD